jgi:hypothetical protein
MEAHMQVRGLLRRRITFQLYRKGVSIKGFPYFFQMDLSNKALSCARLIDDENRSDWTHGNEA